MEAMAIVGIIGSITFVTLGIAWFINFLYELHIDIGLLQRQHKSLSSLVDSHRGVYWEHSGHIMELQSKVSILEANQCLCNCKHKKTK